MLSLQYLVGQNMFCYDNENNENTKLNQTVVQNILQNVLLADYRTNEPTNFVAQNVNTFVNIFLIASAAISSNCDIVPQKNNFYTNLL